MQKSFSGKLTAAALLKRDSDLVLSCEEGRGVPKCVHTCTKRGQINPYESYHANNAPRCKLRLIL